MSSDTFIGDVWIGIGPFKLQLTWQLLLIVGAVVAFLRVLAIVAVLVALRNRGNT